MENKDTRVIERTDGSTHYRMYASSDGIKWKALDYYKNKQTADEVALQIHKTLNLTVRLMEIKLITAQKPVYTLTSK